MLLRRLVLVVAQEPLAAACWLNGQHGGLLPMTPATFASILSTKPSMFPIMPSIRFINDLSPCSRVCMGFLAI